MIPAAFFLLGVGVTCIALVVVAWVAEARAEMRTMRRYSAMSAALSAVGTPRPKATGGVVSAEDAERIAASIEAQRGCVMPHSANEAQRLKDDIAANGNLGDSLARLRAEAITWIDANDYLPESRDADFTP